MLPKQDPSALLVCIFDGTFFGTYLVLNLLYKLLRIVIEFNGNIFQFQIMLWHYKQITICINPSRYRIIYCPVCSITINNGNISRMIPGISNNTPIKIILCGSNILPHNNSIDMIITLIYIYSFWFYIP